MSKIRRIHKNVTLIVSTGRTGTRFFGEVLGNAIDDCVSFHEPDMITLKRKGEFKKIVQFGLYNTTIGKLLNDTGIRAIGLNYLAGRRGVEQTAKALISHRKRFFEKQSESLIIESYNQWYSVLDVLPLVFKEYRVAAVIRDARSWLSSAEKWSLWWHSDDLVARLGLLRLNPQIVDDGEAADRWAGMSQFQRMAWSWSAINHLVTSNAESDPRISVFRFEDLLGHSHQVNEIRRFLEFITHFKDKQYSYSLAKILDSPRVHASPGDSSNAWRDWSTKRCQQVDELCGTLMRRWDYGRDPEWIQRVSR